MGYNVWRTAGTGWRGSSHSATPDRLFARERNRCALPFHGTFEHTLDAKHRLTVPSKFRAALAGGVVVVKGVERNLSVYPEPTYSAFTQAALAGLNPLSPQGREMRRLLYANAADVELDSAGRIMLPAGHRAHAGIDRDVVITGAGDSLELWDRGAWQSYDADLTARAAELTAALAHHAG